MPQIKSSFSLKSKAPNFERDCFETLFEMKHVNKEHIDEGHLSYCKETRKYYTFNSEQRFDDVIGYWKELEAGGGDVEKKLLSLEEVTNEMYATLYPVTCELLTSNGENSIIVEYKEEDISLELSVNIFHKGQELDRGEVSELIIESNDGVVGLHDKLSNKVDFKISSNPEGNHLVTLNVSAVNQTAETSCTIYQRPPVFLGWHKSATPNTGMMNASSLMTKKVSTSSLGTYNYGEVGVGYYFWTFIPESGVTNYSKIDANGYEMIMEEVGELEYMGIKYKCCRKPEASIMSSPGWKVVLS